MSTPGDDEAIVEPEVPPETDHRVHEINRERVIINLNPTEPTKSLHDKEKEF